ncbi:chemotaxis protein CheA [Caulobacter mirabilis]|uniref:Chemotaxis protein CheA n=1 Tax=Caulobacter mirabilis TaxID=69666 RepID=A0A2D2B1P1_9CAUL|nr:chemotaxis protein CheA [Caulobacter mirabilis]ATQ44189.1 chemotaxis protein CheA [Caulobacter mirabilis]
MDPMDAIRTTFFIECDELLAQLEEGLMAMEQGATDSETINSVFRAVHSVKGGGGAFGLDPLVRFSHVFETLLDQIRSGQVDPSETVVATLLRAADMLADHVNAARDGGVADEARSEQIAAAIMALTVGGAANAFEEQPAEIEGLNFTPQLVSLDLPAAAPADDFDLAALLASAGVDAPAAEAADGDWLVTFAPHASLYAKANDAALVLRELIGLADEATVSLDDEALLPLEEMDPAGAYLGWTVRLPASVAEADIRDAFAFVDEDCDLEIKREGGAADTVAVEPQAEESLNLLDSLLLQVKEEPAPDPHPAPAAPAAAVDPAPKPEAVAAGAPMQAAASATAAAPPQTIRVDLDRVDRLINLVGELVINQAMLAQRVHESGAGKATDVNLALTDLELLTRGIQDSVMAIRAQPVKSVFQRMPRLVREVGEATGKRVRLVTEGEGTEVDKTVVEKLSDPITHMIRNAIDHGLETPAEREAAGKSAEGTVRLTAAHRSGRIVIEVADDGKGVDRVRVKAKAIEKGLIATDAQLSDEEIDNLIFAPGFSTASTVSDISGRGVGMDVVKRSVQALGGRITIVSTPGQGSRFSLSLPLTLAVLDGMVVTVGDQTLVAPLTAIIESLKPRAGEVRPLGPHNKVLQIRDAYVPLIDTGAALGFGRSALEPTEGVALLVDSENAGQVALMVDQILGQRQVVIKSLETNYGATDGVAAATILGDGRVALILDIDGLVTAHRRMPPPAPRTESLVLTAAE